MPDQDQEDATLLGGFQVNDDIHGNTNVDFPITNRGWISNGGVLFTIRLL